ncbi:hypothetical protein DFP72DRAFT_1046357 [Ephemerocybe angulata]|uniref:DUF6533 domain-containing protein n=1 Tax=Ephemerocybe angulata TaxID=980116 RepID=A0A8H6HVU3_9AGAR|nr:hypothetical protein DFP72DRAFT_1046357 [Tulosesus angulatus]
MSLSSDELRETIAFHADSWRQEITAIWPQRWMAGKYLFFVVRYLPLASIATDMLSRCRIILPLENIGSSNNISREEGIREHFSQALPVVLSRVLWYNYVGAVDNLCSIHKADGLFDTRYTSGWGCVHPGTYWTSGSTISLWLFSVNQISESGCTSLQTYALPMLACLLLLKIRATTDPAIRTQVSTILFEASSPARNDSVDTERRSMRIDDGDVGDDFIARHPRLPIYVEEGRNIFEVCIFQHLRTHNVINIRALIQHSVIVVRHRRSPKSSVVGKPSNGLRNWKREQREWNQLMNCIARHDNGEVREQTGLSNPAPEREGPGRHDFCRQNPPHYVESRPVTGRCHGAPGILRSGRGSKGKTKTNYTQEGVYYDG